VEELARMFKVSRATFYRYVTEPIAADGERAGDQ